MELEKALRKFCGPIRKSAAWNDNIEVETVWSPMPFGRQELTEIDWGEEIAEAQEEEPLTAA